MNLKKTTSWILRIVAATILLQTLYFKFTAHPESVELFTKLGIEPWGRIATGIIELITGILLLIPSTVFIGSLLGAMTMVGAIGSHLLVIGIESKGDGGQLFMLALVVFIATTILAILHMEEGKSIYKKIRN